MGAVGLIVAGAMALTAGFTGTASATTFEVNGIAKAEAVEIAASLKPGITETWKTTGGMVLNQCVESSLSGTTTAPYTAKGAVTGTISSWSFPNCAFNPTTLTKTGQFYIEHIPGSTNGTVFTENTEIKLKTSASGSLTCKTTTTHIGILKGTATGHATIDINTVLNCGLFLSLVWESSYVFTSPTGLGVIE